MKIALLFISIVFAKDLIGQDSTEHFFKEIGWTIHVPRDFHVLTTDQNSTIVKNGKQGIERALDTNVNLLKAVNLISAKKSKNYFNVTLTPYNYKSDTAQANFVKSQEKAIYQAMSKNAKTDSSSTIMNVGEKTFREFEMTIHLNENASFGMNILTKLYNGYYFLIAYVYLDKATKEQIEHMLIQSTFSK